MRELGFGRLQTPSSAAEGGASRGGPISPRPRTLPKRLAGSAGALGLNLLPMDQFSSASAEPAVPVSLKPEPRRLKDGTSGSMLGVILGLLDRQSLALSERDGGAGSRGPAPPGPGAPSKRRREPSREGRSGSGPSRLQLLANLSSSKPPPPKPERSLATTR